MFYNTLSETGRSGVLKATIERTSLLLQYEDKVIDVSKYQTMKAYNNESTLGC